MEELQLLSLLNETVSGLRTAKVIAESEYSGKNIKKFIRLVNERFDAYKISAASQIKYSSENIFIECINNPECSVYEKDEPTLSDWKQSVLYVVVNEAWRWVAKEIDKQKALSLAMDGHRITYKIMPNE